MFTKFFSYTLSLVLTLLGGCMIASSFINIYLIALSPVAEADLLVMRGELESVSKCYVEGRVKTESLDYTVVTLNTLITFSTSCIDNMRDKMLKIVGSDVTISYAIERDLFLNKRLKVYEFGVSDRFLWSYQETVIQRNNVKVWLIIFSFLFGLVGPLAIYIAWYDFRKSRT
jgi:hypothetical protein